MQGRMVVRGMPLQGTIENVVLPTLLDGENESFTFTNPDFFAYGSNQGGAGTGYLQPV